MKATKPFNAKSVVGDVAFFDVGDGIVARVTIVRDELATQDAISTLSGLPVEVCGVETLAAFQRGDREYVGVSVELERDGWKKSGFRRIWSIGVDWRHDNSPLLNEAAEEVAEWAIAETH